MTKSLFSFQSWASNFASLSFWLKHFQLDLIVLQVFYFERKNDVTCLVYLLEQSKRDNIFCLKFYIFLKYNIYVPIALFLGALACA